MFTLYRPLFLLLLFSAGSAYAQRTNLVQGLVTDARSGKVVSQATVEVDNATSPIQTDEFGVFQLLCNRPNNSRIVVHKRGYQSKSVLVPSGGNNQTLKVALEPINVAAAWQQNRIFTGADLQQLPVKGISSALKLQSGISSTDRSGIYGQDGASDEVIYVVDGIRTSVLPLGYGSIKRMETQLGTHISAEYGDAMSGVVRIDTPTGAERLSGTVEGFSSKVLDAYNDNLSEVTLSGPIVKNKVHFFVGGTYQVKGDMNPSWQPFLAVPEKLVREWEKNPQAIEVVNALGEHSYVVLPGDLPNVSKIAIDPRTNLPIYEGGQIILTDEKGNEIRRLSLGLGNSLYLVGGKVPIIVKRGGITNIKDYEWRAASRDNLSNLNLRGNLTFDFSKDARFRVGYSHMATSQDGEGASVANYHFGQKTEQSNGQLFGTLDLSPTDNTRFRLHVDYEDTKGLQYNPNFSRNVEDVLFYGDIDHPANAGIPRFISISTNNSGSLTDIWLRPTSKDGLWSSNGIHLFYSMPAKTTDLYQKSRLQKTHLALKADHKVGLHQLAFGLDWEQRTERLYKISPFMLARYFEDGEVENVQRSWVKVNKWTDLSLFSMRNLVTYYGYNHLGTIETNQENIDEYIRLFLGNEQLPAVASTAPYRPRYYGGYLQDVIQTETLKLEAGLRWDVFDSQAKVLKDPYALVEIVRAGDLPSYPANIDPFDGVLFKGGDPAAPVVGYRSKEGIFYDATGKETTFNQLSEQFWARHVATKSTMTSAVFEPSTPVARLLPRIVLSLKATDNTLLTANYAVTSQRPPQEYTSNGLQEYISMVEIHRINSLKEKGLDPAYTIGYSMGVQHRFSARAAVFAEVYSRQQKALPGYYEQVFAYPKGNLHRIKNADEKRIKGFEAGVFAQHPAGISIAANYTYLRSELTYGFSSGESPFFTMFVSHPPTLFNIRKGKIIRVRHNQRHQFNALFSFRPSGEALPPLLQKPFFKGIGLTTLFVYKSGLPYDVNGYPSSPFGIDFPSSYYSAEMPATYRLDLKVEKQFELGSSTQLTAYLEVQNVFNRGNVFKVFGFTGQADEDGYLNTPEGLGIYPLESLRRDLYENIVLHQRDFYGMPRLARAGLRFGF